MHPDDEGFLFPHINSAKCISCKRCVDVCQAYYPMTKSDDKQRYYAVKNKDAIRAESSSGGIFTGLSDYILSKGGVVVGAFISHNFEVSHFIAANIEERNLLRGSKYVQSSLGSIFSQIQDILAKGNYVLFVGTPCQVEGLNLFLGKKYDNLITCDLVCHGVASPKVFQSFIEYIQQKGKDKLIKFNFRDKELGWRGYKVSAIYKNKKVRNTLWLRSFNYLFSQNYINRPVCSKCKYISYDRCSDITLGDYWGIECYYPEFEDRLGVSLIITNTEKGEKQFQNIAHELIWFEIKKEEAYQNSLGKLPKQNKKRTAFWACYNKNSYKVAVKKYAEYNTKGFFKNILRKLIEIPFVKRYLSKPLKKPPTPIINEMRNGKT
jgi:coenzyme F420-reducing hydrogenase beta subunit